MSQQFTPRAYGQLITDHVLDIERPGVWAGMGLGKTVSTLNAMNTLQMLDSRPQLVIAPLRVARSTWPDEARKWSHLNHMHVLPIVGSERERLAALKQDAHVYSTNFEQLPWLVEQYEKRPWPFRTVIVDEATKLKGFRLRQGTARAKALARVAHTQCERFVELTGTPSPNGLMDLWGQIWFLDKGERLGRTFDAFKQRWFTQSYDGFSVEARPNAQAEIQGALRDLCLTIDAKDWFDLRDPIVNNIMIDLPAAARAKYEDMEKRMFMELSGHEVEAFGAAARTVKCIAEGTEILTPNGFKPIEQWQPGDQLWDGEEWVNASNLVCNGVMPVVKCLHVSMTADHKVLTTDGWKTAEEINNADASGRFDRAPVRVPDGAPARRHHREHEGQAGHLAGALRVREGVQNDRPEFTRPESGREKVMRVPTRGNAAGCLGVTRHDGASGLGNMDGDEIAMHESSRQGLAKLRGPRHRGVRTVGAIRRLLGGHGADVRGGADLGAHGQQRKLHPGELSVGNAKGASEQHETQRVREHPRRADDCEPSGGSLRSKAGDTGPAPAPGVATGKSIDTARVYDLVNCGPRHRFTVRGADGKLLIVHNCLQIASGAAYVGESGSEWVEVHDAKLQALEEVVEEAAGMPVLVAYHFKSDLARLLKAFPKGRQLDQNPQTIRDWNAGKIPVLFAHPASAGHGLNLQDGGNILVFFSHWWNLEERMQIIERIGPTRQLQAGHNRPMFIHNLIAAGTVDELVIERVNTKRETQDILLDAMKVKGYL